MTETTTIMAALSVLTPPQLSDLTFSILSDIRQHHHRLSAVLSSPTLFSLTLHHLHSLSLPHKTLLIARHLLSALRQLTRHFRPKQPPPPLPSTTIKNRDLDAVLLLLLLCEIRRHNPEALETSPAKWRVTLSQLWCDTMLTLSGIGFCYGSALISYIEMVTRCWKFVGEMGCCGGDGDGKVAASPAAVVALPSVEVRGRGVVECVICKEVMREGRDVCELPCEHLFHWMCILPWLRKRNTCPCCRFPLPTDDVFGEIQRLWEVLVKMGSLGCTTW